MKKSTLMMIGILVLVPMYFTAKVLLLKRHFYNGDLKPVHYPVATEKWDEKKISGVKHLIIDGKVVTSRSKLKTTSTSTRVWPRVQIEQWAQPFGGVETLQFPKLLRNLIKTQVVSDTLFISFQKEGDFKFPMIDEVLLSIHLNSIQSIKTDNGTYECENFSNKATLQLSTLNSTIKFNQAKLEKLNILASTYSSVHVLSPNNIRGVFFSLSDSSKLIFHGSDSTKTLFKPLAIDSTSIISFSGSAHFMKKYMN